MTFARLIFDSFKIYFELKSINEYYVISIYIDHKNFMKKILMYNISTTPQFN